MSFTNKQDYLNQRETLLNAARTALESGNIAESEAKTKEVEDLDREFDAYSVAQANLNALSGAVRGGNVFDQEPDSMGASQKNTYSNKSDEYRVAWAKVMHGDKLTADEQIIVDLVNEPFRNAATTTSDHTLVIPETIKAGIWERAGELHPVIQDLYATFVKGDLTIIKDTSADSDADWVDEADESSDATFTEGELNLTGCELCKSITVSWKLKKMSMDDYIPYIIRKLGKKVGSAIAKALFTGNGRPGASDSWKPQAKGVCTALAAETDTPQVISYTAADGIKYNTLTKAMAAIQSVYKSGASIYAKNTTIWNQLANILDTNKRPIFVPDVATGGVGRIFGLTVKEEDGVAEGEIVIGNYKDGYVFNFNESMTIYTEEHVKARTTDYMAYGIADGDVLDTKAFAHIKLASA